MYLQEDNFQKSQKPRMIKNFYSDFQILRKPFKPGSQYASQATPRAAPNYYSRSSQTPSLLQPHLPSVSVTINICHSVEAMMNAPDRSELGRKSPNFALIQRGATLTGSARCPVANSSKSTAKASIRIQIEQNASIQASAAGRRGWGVVGYRVTRVSMEALRRAHSNACSKPWLIHRCPLKPIPQEDVSRVIRNARGCVGGTWPGRKPRISRRQLGTRSSRLSGPIISRDHVCRADLRALNPC